MKLKILVLIFFSFYSCSGNIETAKDCNSKSRLFIERLSKSDLDIKILKGLTLESVGVDESGKRFLRPIVFTNREKERYSIPSLQRVKGEKKEKLTDFEYVAFADQIGIGRGRVEESLESYIDEVVNMYDKLEIKTVHSQLHLGDFIEFKFYDGCSVWFKMNDAYLNEPYTILFEEAEELAPNWYILTFRNTKPVLKKHPPNMRLN